MSAEESSYLWIAIGRSERFGIDVYEASSGPEALSMTITALVWTFRFSITDFGVLSRALSFLREHTGTCIYSEIVLGSFRGASVCLIKDDEFDDRFWVRASEGGQMVEFTLVDSDAHELTEAMAHALEDLSV